MHEVRRTALHVGCRSTREREQQDALGIDSVEDEVRHAMRKRVRLAGARARDDQQRPVMRVGPGAESVLGGNALLRIERREKVAR
jgi:hypothetical protein